MKFPAFAFPSHPCLLALIPNAFTVKKKKTFSARGRWAMASIQMSRYLPLLPRAIYRLPAGSPEWHPSSRKAKRIECPRRDSPESGPPAAPPVP